MKLKVETKINPRQLVSIEIEGKMDDCLRGANAMLAFKGVCGLCQNPDILLQTKIAKGYKFIDFVCTACGARASWGQYKEGGYFLKEWEVYNANKTAPKQDTSQNTPQEEAPF